ncbi:hypothetical protein D3C74_447500 [compost metagenome]
MPRKTYFLLFIQNGCNLFFRKAAVGIQICELTRSIDSYKSWHRTDTHFVAQALDSWVCRRILAVQIVDRQVLFLADIVQFRDKFPAVRTNGLP